MLWIFSGEIFAQVRSEVSFRHYDTRQGLPSTQIQGLFEDSRGFIWSITDRGAARFNGYEFSVFTTRHGLPTNNVLLINEDRKGRIWFMCNTGQYAYLEGDSIYEYKGNEKISALLRDRLPGPFFFDEADTLWITTFSGIQLFKCFSDSVQEFIPSPAAGATLPTYYLRKVGKKLVTLQIGEVQNDNRITTTDNISYLLEVAGECKLACSVEAEPGTWAVAGPGGYVIFDESANVQAFFDYSPYLFSTLEHDRSGHLWLTNSNGAYRIRNFRNGPDDADVFFEGHFTTAVLQDRAGNYWFGDRDNGVFFVPSIDVKVFNSGTPSKQNKCISFREFDNQLFYCDGKGHLYQNVSDSVVVETRLTIPSGVTLDFVFTARGNVVVGNKPYLYNRNSRTLVSLDENRTVRKALPLKDGRCAFALADGLAFLDQNEKWNALPAEVFKERSNALLESDDGSMLYIGTNNGVFVYEGGRVSELEPINSKYKARVSDLDIWNNYLVIATRSSGIILALQDESYLIDENSGLLSNTVDCIEISPENDIWIGSASGLQRLRIVDLKSGKYNWFKLDSQKGLPSNEVNDIIFTNNKLYVATNSGMTVLLPDSPSLNGSPASVLITLFSSGMENMVQAAVRKLSHDQNDIRIGFQSLNYRTGSNTKYRYRLIGLQQDWQTTLNRSIEYWALPPGKYRFEVEAMNEDGEWGTTNGVDFEIEAHFTQTGWFKLSLILGIALILLLLLLIVYRAKKRKLEIRSKMIELRQQALNANMNPHFIFNALGSIQHFINSGKAEEANEYLADFSQLIRKNLENNQHSLIDLEDELEGLHLYLKLEKLRFGNKLEYGIEIGQDVPLMDCRIPPMLLQPYVENALIHGILPLPEGGSVTVNVSFKTDHFMVEVLDNGVGIRQGQNTQTSGKRSLAMKMNDERLETLSELTGKHFRIEVKDRSELSPPECGTRVLVIIPVDFDENALRF
jgi:ligand-binding sensor domain-containing protein